MDTTHHISKNMKAVYSISLSEVLCGGGNDKISGIYSLCDGESKGVPSSPIIYPLL